MKFTLEQFISKVKLGEGTNSRLTPSIPSLDIGTRMGSTDYIDILTPKDMVAPVMYGYDRFGRFFLAIHYRKNDKEDVMTIFHRYTSDFDIWVNARGFPMCLMSDKYWELLGTLLTKGRITTHNEIVGDITYEICG